MEFNARFGDPETQPLLALLESPLGVVLKAAADGRLAEVGTAAAGATAPRSPSSSPPHGYPASAAHR